MDYYDPIFNYLIPIFAIIAFSIFCAFNVRNHSFSTRIFLTSVAIGIGVEIYFGLMPIWMIVISAIGLTGILFMENSEGEHYE